MSKIDYSLIVPVYNEEDNLYPLVENIEDAMQAVTPNYEVIFVDDGSEDKSRETIKAICQARSRYHYLFFEKNHGQTAAFDAGFKAARGEYIITMDADLQTDCHDVPKLLDKLDRYDAAVGFREKRSDTWVKRISSKIANAVRNKLSGESIRDTGCPLKVMPAEVVSKWKLYNGMHRFFPTLLKLEGYTVCEVPVSHHSRIHGQSKYNVWNRVFRATKDLFAVRWMKSRYLHYQIIDQR